MIVPTTPPWPRNLIPHEFSCQPKTLKFYPRNLIILCRVSVYMCHCKPYQKKVRCCVAMYTYVNCFCMRAAVCLRV